MQDTAGDRGAELEESIRAELRRARAESGATFRSQARAIGVTLSWLNDFDKGVRSLRQPVTDRAKRGIVRHYPQLTRALTRLSLLWLEDGEPPDDGPHRR